MPWVRVDDGFSEHPKLAAAGPLAWALWMAGLAYCNRNLTDGHIPWATAQALVSWSFLEPPDAETQKRRRVNVGITSGMAGEDVTCEYVISLLVYHGLWEPTDGGFYVHDYPAYQPTRAVIEAEKGRKAAAGRAGGIATAVARAVAPAEAGAVAKGQPKPKPKPVSVTNSMPVAQSDREMNGEAEEDEATVNAYVAVGGNPLNGGALSFVYDLVQEFGSAEVIPMIGKVAGSVPINKLLGEVKTALLRERHWKAKREDEDQAVRARTNRETKAARKLAYLRGEITEAEYDSGMKP